MAKPKTKIAFLFPGQGAVPEAPLINFLDTPVASSYTTFSEPNTPQLADFCQSAIKSDEAAQLGVFSLTLAMATEALTHCQPDVVTGYSSGLYAAMVTSGCLSHSQGNHAIHLAYKGVQQASENSMMVGVIGLRYSIVADILYKLANHGQLSLVETPA